MVTLPPRLCTSYLTWATANDLPWLDPAVEPPLLAAVRATAALYDAILIEGMVPPPASMSSSPRRPPSPSPTWPPRCTSPPPSGCAP